MDAEEGAPAGFWGWLVGPDGPLDRAAAAWSWWRHLLDGYAWQEIGCFVLPAMIVVAILMFRGISRLHLRG